MERFVTKNDEFYISRPYEGLIDMWIFLAVLLLTTACAKVPQADDVGVSSLVQTRIARNVHWNQECKEDAQVCCLIDLMLKQTLTRDAAVQIALLNNPNIQATFEEVGIAQADLVQAGLLQNPIFGGFVRFPKQHSMTTNAEFSVTQSFLEVFLIPLRKKVATTELEQTELRVANVVLDLAFDVEQNYFQLAAEQNRLELLRLVVATNEVESELANRQRKAGNINELEWQNRHVRFIEAKLALTDSENQIVHLRKKLTDLLGLRRGHYEFSIENELPALPKEEASEEALYALACSQRLDLALQQLEIKRFVQMGATKEWWAYTDPALGLSWENDTDGSTVFGPTAAVALPFFNSGQADRARLLALLKQSQHRYRSLQIQISSEIKQAHSQLQHHRKQIELYINEQLPLQAEILQTSQRFYNVMGLNLYKFLKSKQEELQAKIGYQLALRNYWLVKVELDRAVGGSKR